MKFLEKKNPIVSGNVVDSMFLPNYSGLTDGARKTEDTFEKTHIKTQSFATRVDTTNNPHVSPTDFQHTIIFTSNSTVTVNLPLAASFPGRELVLKRTGATGVVIINRLGSDNIDGGVNAALARTNQAVKYVSDGVSSWKSVGMYDNALMPIADFGNNLLSFFREWKLIMMYHGDAFDIPDGWQLCDGTNGTPDLRDRFIVGSGNQYSTDDAGGSEEHTHTYDELCTEVEQAFSNVVIVPECNSQTIHNVNHLPPYYALAFIMVPSEG